MRFLALLGLVVVTGCSRSSVATPQEHQLQGEAFGTTWRVKWVGEDDAGVQGDLLAALESVDSGMSTWRPDSEIMRVRRGPGAVPVSQDTYEVVAASLQLARASGGAFDPTVQSLMEFWGFHGEPRAAWPTEEELASARAVVGYEKVMPVRNLDGTYTIDAGETALDLSAIAKGFAVDKLSDVLLERGHNQHLVEVGGEVVARGKSARGDGWVLGVDKPVRGAAPGVDYAAVFELVDVAMATSGNYRTRVTVGDREVGHTLDPRTGYPVQSDILSATVIAPDCMTADGWATALMVLGASEGLALIEEVPGVAAFLQVMSEDGVREVSSMRLSEHPRKR